MTNLPNNDGIKVYLMPEKLVMANSDKTRQELEVMIDSGTIRLILDLSAVQQMDSSGLAVLVAAWRRLKSLDGVVALLSPRPTVRALLDLTRMHELFDIFDDLEAAQGQIAA